MNCKKCLKPFNVQNRKPVELPCKHLCCFKCVYKMKKSQQVICPEDQLQYSPQDKFIIRSEIIEKSKEELLKAETIGIITERIQRLSESFDHNFKIITLGSTFTGKTSILQKYFKNLFGKTTPTITVDFFTKNFKMNDKNIIITAYDTAGSENFKSMTGKYVKDKHCILLIFDITQRKTFQDLENWLEWANQLKQDKAFYMLVGAKLDLESEREVDKKEAQQWAAKYEMQYLEVSSKTSVNINYLFQRCIIKCLSRFKDQDNEQSEIFHVEVKQKKDKGCFNWFKSLFKQFRSIKFRFNFQVFLVMKLIIDYVCAIPFLEVQNYFFFNLKVFFKVHIFLDLQSYPNPIYLKCFLVNKNQAFFQINFC